MNTVYLAPFLSTMNTVNLAPFLFVLILVALVVGGIVIIGLAAMFRPGARKKPRELDLEETRMIQEMHQCLNKLEDRVESLETIMLERELDAKVRK